MMNQDIYNNVGRLVLRLTVGGLMLFHGVAKLGSGGSLNWISGQLAASGFPEVLAYGVYIGEIVAPLMIIAGVYCRVGGIILVVNMLFAVFLAHGGELLDLNKNGGWALELQGFYFFCAAVVALFGSGRFAVKPD